MFFYFFFKRNLNNKFKLLVLKNIANFSSDTQKKRKKWILPSPLSPKEIQKMPLKKDIILETSYNQKSLNFRNNIQKKNNMLQQWKKHKIALKEKFPEGWNPLKKLSPYTLTQIKALRQQSPEYTVPVLSDMFKVSPEAIRRILKSKWQPSPEEYADKLARWKKRGDCIRNMRFLQNRGKNNFKFIKT